MSADTGQSYGRKLPIWAAVMIVLLFVNLSWMVWRWIDDADMRTLYKQFRVSTSSDNGMAVIGITELRTGRFIWTRSDFAQRGAPVEEHGFYFGGDKVFGVWSKSNLPPVYSVFFHRPGKGVTWWQNRAGADVFTQRTFYSEDDNLSRDEVWYGEAWHVIDRRNGTNGIIINGQWCRLGFDTNGLWTTKAVRE